VNFLIAGLYTDEGDLFSGFIAWGADIVAAPGFPAAMLFLALAFLGKPPHEFPTLSTPAVGSTIPPPTRTVRRPALTESMTYTLTITSAARSTSVRITGDLDYQTTDDFVAVASQLLAQQHTVRDLHLDFSELAFLNSAALSGLLILYRRTSQAGVALHLDHRPPFLDRVLQVTGLFDHFDLTRSDAETGGPRLLSQGSSGESGAR
jgi:anti-anti-sigma factor